MAKLGTRTAAGITMALTIGVGCGGVEPKLSSIQQHVFNVGCNTASCHGSGKAGGLDLREGASFTALVDATPTDAEAAANGLRRVVPGDVVKSFLYLKLQHQVAAEYGARMPQLGEPLDGASVEAIRLWILDGAKDD